MAGLGRLLDDDQPVYALHPPADAEADAPGHPLERLADRYLAEIDAVAPTGPLAVAGNSCGGLIAWELAQRRARAGAPPPLVGLLDTPWRITALNHLVHRAGVALTRRLAPRDREGLPRVARVARAIWSDEGHDLQVRATCGYAADPYPGPVALFMADCWRLGGLTPAGLYIAPRRWARVAGGGLRLRTVPGNHLSFVREPLVRRLAAALDEALAEFATTG
jgi:thioesterase domain-containing protein